MLTPGMRLGPYEIVAPLGAGGMGEVYRARDTRLGRDVAVKILPAEFAQDAERLRRFEREARAAAALNHPNILVLYDIGTQDGAPYIVTELLEGQALRQKLREGSMTPADALDLGVQIAQGLAAAHGKGILHRDLKPENLFVTKDGRVKILDFGLARLRAQDPISGSFDTEQPTRDTPTRQGAILGTVGYMSPQQAEGKPVDLRSDIFSLGAVLYEMVAGRRAFEGDSPVSILSAILTKTPPPAGSLRPGVPPDLDHIIRRCLEKDPERRYRSTGELCKELTECHDALVHRRISLKALLRNPRVVIPAALVLIAIVAGATWLGFRVVRQNRARTQLIPEIERLAKARDYWGAFLLAREAQPILGKDPLLQRTLQDAVSMRVWTVRLWPMDKEDFLEAEPTKLEGAEIFARPPLGDETSWVCLGRSGDKPLLTPLGPAVYRGQHPAADPMAVACAFKGPKGKGFFTLYPKGKAPAGMQLAEGGGGPVSWINYAGFTKVSSAETGPFWIDMLEVTNRAFKAFVDGGGYQKREIWKHPFVKDGMTLPWEEAMALFKDSTGRPGPAGWELSTFPEGRAEYPVTGVSWYEAAAYAEFVGKRLPTVSHWEAAVNVEESGFYLWGSNFSGRLAPVGSYPGAINGSGLFDLAGNAREWCYNEAGNLRVTLGEAATEAVHYFNWLAPRPPFDRSPETGFRCIRNVKGPVPEVLERPLTPAPPEPTKIAPPFPEAAWQTWVSFLSYPKAPLDARTEFTDDSSPHWRMEKVSFTAAYGGERMLAYLFLPKSGPPPYQAVVFWPGGAPICIGSSENGRRLPYLPYFDYLVKDGRAVLYPALKGTFERGGKEGENPFDVVKGWGDDMTVMQVKDLCRSVDLLQSRPDIAGYKIAYLALSWGAMEAPKPLAYEKRIGAASLIGAGLFPDDPNGSWARHVTTPVQMLSGRFDYMPVDTAQAPLFQLFATPPDKKRHLLFNAGHGLDGCEKEMITRTLEWYDRYLGPVRK